jgi:hypothetical protein
MLIEDISQMEEIQKLAESLAGVVNTVFGKDIKYSSSEISRKYPDIFTYYILTSRM